MKDSSGNPNSTGAAASAPQADKSVFNEAFLPNLFNLTPNEILVISKEGKIFAANESFCEYVKFSRENLVGADWHKFVSVSLAEMDEWLEKTVELGKYACEIPYKTGDQRYTSCTVELVFMEDEPGYIVAFHQPISENGKTFPEIVEALQKSEESYQAFIENSTEGIWCCRSDTPISVDLSVEEQIRKIFEDVILVECNDTLAKMYGFKQASDLKGKKLKSILANSPLDSRELLREFIESDYRLRDVEIVMKNRFGKEMFFLVNLIGVIKDGKLRRAWATQRDISNLKQTEQAYIESEQKLRQSQKIEPLGRLAGGIAHDFNNFLAVIMLNVDMLNMQMPEEDPRRPRVKEIKAVTDKAARMVKQLLAFGRKQTLQPHPIVLNQVVEEFSKILGSLIGEHIEIDLNLAEDLGVCFVDPNQITQVLMNLAVNSRDAMPDGGLLKISTANIEVDENTLRHKAQPTGSYIELAFSDNGSGIDAETQKHIFEPFFTTKEAGKGTGLGLATVYGIVKQSNGFVWVDSSPGEGTLFAIQFPRIDKDPKEVKKESVRTMPGGNETILVVEDEELIRRTCVEILRNLGYKVLEARDGHQAVEFTAGMKEKIDLLLTDVVMPRMNGRDLAEKIKQNHPEISVLFMSGYTDDIISRHGVLEENVHFLGKPFTPAKLAVKVRKALKPSTGSEEEIN